MWCGTVPVVRGWLAVLRERENSGIKLQMELLQSSEVNLVQLSWGTAAPYTRTHTHTLTHIH